MFRKAVITILLLVPFALAGQTGRTMWPDTLQALEEAEAMEIRSAVDDAVPEVRSEGIDEAQARPRVRVRVGRPEGHEPWRLWEHADEIAAGVFEWLLMR